MSDYKICVGCSENLPISDFKKISNDKDLTQSKCKVCIRKRKKELRVKYYEKEKETNKKYRENNRDKISKHYHDTKVLKGKHIQYQWPPPIDKKCTKCEIIKPVEDFVKSNKTKHGIGSVCKDCCKIKSKIQRDKNRSNHPKPVNEPNKLTKKEKDAEYRRNNKPNGEVNRCNSRAKRHNAIHKNHNKLIELEYHKMRYRLESCLGIKFAVDYILPLEKDGYHHHNNMQVIPRNIQKQKWTSLKYENELLIHWKELPPFMIDHIKNLSVTLDEMSKDKRCSRCGVYKKFDEFYLKYKNSNILHCKCKVCSDQDSGDWKSENKEKVKQYRDDYWIANREILLKRSKKYKRANKKRLSESSKRYRARFPHKTTAYSNRRKSLKLNSMHPDLNKDIEMVIYQTRYRITKCLGIMHHVDHILPLNKGGFHHHLNLQILPEFINLSKSDELDYKNPSIIHWTELPEFLLINLTPEGIRKPLALSQ